MAERKGKYRGLSATARCASGRDDKVLGQAAVAARADVCGRTWSGQTLVRGDVSGESCGCALSFEMWGAGLVCSGSGRESLIQRRHSFATANEPHPFTMRP